MRYAETAGHEFDYDIPNAFRYRDYLIRAFNLDVPYDQFVVEHISGDALESPRRHPVEGFNESAIATGFYVLGEGTHSPVDIREEQMRRIDNQLDVLSKTFLGLTLACARCHDHKFDPITAKDYYALAGYLVSSRHQQAFIDPPDRIGKFANGIRDVKKQIAAIMVDAGDQLPQPLRSQAATLFGPLRIRSPRFNSRLEPRKMRPRELPAASASSKTSTEISLTVGSSPAMHSAIAPPAPATFSSTVTATAPG